VVDLLSLGLSREELADLHSLAKSREWTSLLKLSRLLQETATSSLIGFSSPTDAYERRGFVRGVKHVTDIVAQIYENTHTTREENNAGNTNSQIAGDEESGRSSVGRSYADGWGSAPDGGVGGDESGPAGWSY